MYILKNTWIKWPVLAIIAYGLLFGNRPQQPSTQNTTTLTKAVIVNNAPPPSPPQQEPQGSFLDKTAQRILLPLVEQQVRAQLKPPTSVSTIRKEEELVLIDTVKGTGDSAVCGNQVTLDYDAMLADGTVFDSSRKNKRPLVFTIGKGQVIHGLENGVVGMKTTGRRKITIPARLAFDNPDFTNTLVPSGTTVTYDVELVSINKATAAEPVKCE